MTNAAAAKLWSEFLDAYRDIPRDEPYQVWYFGNSAEMAADLAALVVAGTKTATASLQKTNELRPDEAPMMNGYSVVTDYYGEPLCVIRTTEIVDRAFTEVDAAFAADEGEGDLSLNYWRRVHRDYFEREAATLGFSFDENAIVCCEHFRLVYKR